MSKVFCRLGVVRGERKVMDWHSCRLVEGGWMRRGDFGDI